MVMVDFVKGHMGGDEIILLDGRQIPTRYKPSSIRSILKPPSIRGREVGLLYRPKRRGHIRVKMYELSSEGPIPMCGGLTQVLGMALSETDLARRFFIRLKRPDALVGLETDSGLIPIHITFRKHGHAKITTEMRSYLEKCYGWGREEMTISGVPVERFGLFYFMDIADLRRKYPGIDFTRNNRESLEVIETMRKETGLEKIYGIIKNTSEPGHVDASFQFAPPDPQALEGEDFACGTGSTTVALYELFHGRLPVDGKGRGHLLLNLTSRGILPVDQKTEVDVQVRNGRAINAWFSHNYVRIIAKGKVDI